MGVRFHRSRAGAERESYVTSRVPVPATLAQLLEKNRGALRAGFARSRVSSEKCPLPQCAGGKIARSAAHACSRSQVNLPRVRLVPPPTQVVRASVQTCPPTAAVERASNPRRAHPDLGWNQCASARGKFPRGASMKSWPSLRNNSYVSVLDPCPSHGLATPVASYRWPRQCQKKECGHVLVLIFTILKPCAIME